LTHFPHLKAKQLAERSAQQRPLFLVCGNEGEFLNVADNFSFREGDERGEFALVGLVGGVLVAEFSILVRG
jgi:hypothetical protein